MPVLTNAQDRPWLTDFATIFAHMWYRDFPLQLSWRDKAQRADWTTHIGITVRSTADLMGLFTHFESGGRTDAILKDNQDKAVAAFEWEWSALHRGDEIVTEFEKLKKSCVTLAGIRFMCLIGYARTGTSPRSRDDYTKRSTAVLDGYTKRWNVDLPPLLLVVIHFEWKGDQKNRRFVKMTIDEIAGESRNLLREQPAYPWEVSGSRSAQETKSSL
ncbi:MAG TPA: hypothetical protein DDY78_15635 [Planctomycetales bacterium]|jgi:hypothetical protein|nr:hypothetical protein [Planctomycetales bacterium]